jgi:hypothetical protein
LYGASARLSSVALKPGALKQDSIATLEIRFIRGGSGKEELVSTPTAMTRIDQSSVIGNIALILGHSNYLSETVIVDCISRRVVRAIGYYTQLLDDRWLVSVEYYSNHIFPPFSGTGVVLVRDVTKPFHECGGADSSLPTDLAPLIKAAGVPVYPRKNALTCSYRNVLEADEQVTNVYPNTFVMLDDNRLSFIASSEHGGTRGDPIIVSIDVSNGPEAATSITEYPLESVAQAVGLAHAAELQITGATRSGGDVFQVQLEKGVYKQGSVAVPLPRKMP